jgi:uncharacterized protein (TIGR02145 family)
MKPLIKCFAQRTIIAIVCSCLLVVIGPNRTLAGDIQTELTDTIRPMNAPTLAEPRMVRIGSQTWMATNLDVDTYRNGDSISQVIDVRHWNELETGGWCHYNNDPMNGRIFGRLYNWYAVSDPRGLCPVGWRLPGEEDWAKLAEALGGEDLAGGQLKAINFWVMPNTAATNGSGFTALPGGYRFDNGFSYLGTTGHWWSLTEEDRELAWCHLIGYNDGGLYRTSFDKKLGLSVRCIRE